jgi:hypothetical protein
MRMDLPACDKAWAASAAMQRRITARRSSWIRVSAAEASSRLSVGFAGGVSGARRPSGGATAGSPGPLLPVPTGGRHQAGDSRLGSHETKRVREYLLGGATAGRGAVVRLQPTQRHRNARRERWAFASRPQAAAASRPAQGPPRAVAVPMPMPPGSCPVPTRAEWRARDRHDARRPLLAGTDNRGLPCVPQDLASFGAKIREAAPRDCDRGPKDSAGWGLRCSRTMSGRGKRKRWTPRNDSPRQRRRVSGRPARPL